jgi:hypothetical protein
MARSLAFFCHEVPRGVVLAAIFLSALATGFAQSGVSPAQKKYQKEVATLFDSLEVTDVTLPTTVRADGRLQPALTLRNKTNRELLVPVALGIAAGQGGVLGYPSWQFERTDKKFRHTIKHDGSLIRCDRIDAGGVVEADARSQSAISPELLGLLPGEYKVAMTFRPHTSAGGANGAALAFKPMKLTVLPKEGKPAGQDAAPEAPSSVADPRFRFRFGSGKPPQSVDSTITLGELELSSQSIKAGAPLRLRFDVTLSKGKDFPAAAEGLTPPLNFSWNIHRNVVRNGAKVRVYVTHLTVGFGSSQWTELCRQGTLVLQPQVETVGMEPGSYDISVRLWQTGGRSEEGFDSPNRLPFKVTK